MARTSNQPWKAQVMKERRESAEKRNAVTAAMSPQERLKQLDKNGHTAEKERARLQSLINSGK